MPEIVVVIMIFSIIAFKQIKDFLLKKEQIKADAMVRAEEIMAKNKLEMEKLFYKEDQKVNPEQTSNKANNQYDDGSIDYKASEKMKY
jgi:hypothetical protein